jgi:hypothetical protein
MSKNPPSKSVLYLPPPGNKPCTTALMFILDSNLVRASTPDSTTTPVVIAIMKMESSNFPKTRGQNRLNRVVIGPSDYFFMPDNESSY